MTEARHIRYDINAILNLIDKKGRATTHDIMEYLGYDEVGVTWAVLDLIAAGYVAEADTDEDICRALEERGEWQNSYKLTLLGGIAKDYNLGTEEFIITEVPKEVTNPLLKILNQTVRNDEYNPENLKNNPILIQKLMKRVRETYTEEEARGIDESFRKFFGRSLFEDEKP